MTEPVLITKEDLLTRQSFSKLIPTLQLAWDSTSLGLFKECPRKYQLSIVEGWAPRHESIHLKFGQVYHSALEAYDKAKCAGMDHDAAQREAVHVALVETWDKELGRPWTSDDPNKNRFTLVRSVVWYLEQFKNDPVKTIILEHNGKPYPAVELSFRMEIGVSHVTEEELWLCGHIDRLGELEGHAYVLDRKTTKYTLGQDYFDKYSPDNQFSLYQLAGRTVLGKPITGLIVDAVQLAVTFSRFERGIVPRSNAQLDEWFKDAMYYIKTAEDMAAANYWPMNDKSCGNYGGCPFRQICAKDPATREQWLKGKYVRRSWDPLKSRGDI